MSDTLISAINSHAETILNRVKILDNVYFTQLKDQTMSLDTFRETQTQFYFAVKFFARPMAALVARIPSPKQRLKILHNIVEEHGEMSEDAFHANTFKSFLKNIGQTELDFSKISVWPQVRAFNSTLATACILDEVETGVACMGIIELAFSTISLAIARAVVNNGWMDEENLAHYKLHEELDVRHAADFFEVIASSWNDPNKQYHIKQGLELGAYAFDRLYRDLIEYNGS